MATAKRGRNGIQESDAETKAGKATTTEQQTHTQTIWVRPRLSNRTCRLAQRDSLITFSGRASRQNLTNHEIPTNSRTSSQPPLATRQPRRPRDRPGAPRAMRVVLRSHERGPRAGRQGVARHLPQVFRGDRCRTGGPMRLKPDEIRKLVAMAIKRRWMTYPPKEQPQPPVDETSKPKESHGR